MTYYVKIKSINKKQCEQVEKLILIDIRLVKEWFTVM